VAAGLAQLLNAPRRARHLVQQLFLQVRGQAI
jgi:hypothetical protein